MHRDNTVFVATKVLFGTLNLDRRSVGTAKDAMRVAGSTQPIAITVKLGLGMVRLGGEGVVTGIAVRRL